MEILLSVNLLFYFKIFNNTLLFSRYIEAFTKMVPLYNAFERGVSEKMILAFAKNEESLDAARNAGATKVGGLDLIEDISKVRNKKIINAFQI